MQIRVVTERQKLFQVFRLPASRSALGPYLLQHILRQDLEYRFLRTVIVIKRSRGSPASLHDVANVGGVQAYRAENVPRGCFDCGAVLLLCTFSFLRGAIRPRWRGLHRSEPAAVMFSFLVQTV